MDFYEGQLEYQDLKKSQIPSLGTTIKPKNQFQAEFEEGN